MAEEYTQDSAYNGPGGAAYARERDLRAGGTRIFADLDQFEREAWKKYWSLVLELAREMQGGGRDE